jgi:hypothetical protein
MTSRDRSDVIHRFRERIRQGQRLKLSQTELETLIAGFITQLQSYEVVTLFPAQDVLAAITRLRQLQEMQAITRLTGTALMTALNGFNQKLNSMCGKVLMQVVPPLEGKQAVSIHNLRSLYGAIAVYLFCPERQHEYAFV